jgi:AraC-like DNA-binding protein
MPGNAADFAAVRFSTDEVPERDRMARWREEFGRIVVRCDFEPLADVSFRAQATLRALPGLRTIACSVSPVRARRSAALAADGDDGIGLFVNMGSRAAASQRRRGVVLGAGDAVLIGHGPSVVTPAPDGFIGMIVPHAALAKRVKNIDDATMRLIPRRSEPLQILMNYMRLLPDQLVLGSPKLRRTVVRHIHDLMALAVAPRRAAQEVGPSAVAAARLDIALDCIAQSFADPALSVAAVAKRLNISPRYLQQMLERAGTSFSARVNELRLQRASTLLTQARNGTRRISDVALEAGFSDISYFNRLFRSRFGCTPSAFRDGGERVG